MSCHSVRSCFSPLLSVKRSSVAMLNFTTLVPPGVERISGSFPRRPTRITLLIMVRFSKSNFKSKRGALVVFLQDVEKHGEVVTDAAADHAKMPHSMHVRDALRIRVENDARGVEDAADREPHDRYHW